MKKFFLGCLIICTSFVSNAQKLETITSERTFTMEAPKAPSWNHSGFFLNTGIGVLAGDDVDTDFGWEFGWGYRWHIASGVSWEVARLGFNVGVSNFKEMFDLRLTTGIRYDTPRFEALKGKSAYANFCFGYGFLMDSGEHGGFAYEIGAGIKLSRKCSVGLFWQGDAERFDGYDWYDDTWTANWGVFGVKIEWQFR